MKETAPELYPVVDDAFIAPGRALEAPLPVLGEQADAGDGQAYMQVYMGAAFWMALDDALRKQGCRAASCGCCRNWLREGSLQAVRRARM